jgi:hypothetical protein
MLRHACLACLCKPKKVPFRLPNAASASRHLPAGALSQQQFAKHFRGFLYFLPKSTHSKPITSGILFAAPAAYFKRPYRNRPGPHAVCMLALPLRDAYDKDLALSGQVAFEDSSSEADFSGAIRLRWKCGLLPVLRTLKVASYSHAPRWVAS